MALRLVYHPVTLWLQGAPCQPTESLRLLLGQCLDGLALAPVDVELRNPAHGHVVVASHDRCPKVEAQAPAS